MGSMTVAEARAMIGKPIEILLPSGLCVEVKRLTPLDYLNEGITDIPNEFATFLVDLHKGTLDLNSEAAKNKKNWELFNQFIKVTIEKGAIKPPIIFRYDAEKAKDHLLFQELTSVDQAVLIDAITGKK